MESVIKYLKERREKVEREFIKNSLIIRSSLVDSPIPDTKHLLDELYELNGAISILENHSAKVNIQK